VSQPAERARRIPPLKSRPIRVVLKWQLLVTVAATVVAAAVAGVHAAVSAALGGTISLAAGVAYALLLGLSLGKAEVPTLGASLLGMFRAEAGKILIIVGGLWLTLSVYREVVPVAFFATFVTTVVVFSMAFFVRD